MKQITRDTYLKALGLFTLANEHCLKMEEIRKSLLDLLEAGDDMSSYTGELVWEPNFTVQQFNDSLKRDGIVFASPAGAPDAMDAGQ